MLQSDEAHLRVIIEWLYKECLSAGGDGDAWWYTTHIPVADLFPLVKAFNDSGPKWNLELRGGDIIWWHKQEAVCISGRPDFVSQIPSWAQVVLKL